MGFDFSLGGFGGTLTNALLAGALTAIPQADRPIVLLLLRNGLPAWLHWVVPRPEDLAYTHPTRASAIQTLGGAYVDDFGSGIADITLRGNTGYKLGLIQTTGQSWGPDAGDVMMINLRNMLVFNYHQQRLDLAKSSQDPNQIQLLLVDVLNAAVWLVYPRSFQLQRSRQRPLLYQYTLQMWGLDRLL